MSKKTRSAAEQEVQELEGTVVHTNHRASTVVVLCPDGILYRYEYPPRAVQANWTEGMLVRVYFVVEQLAITVQTMEELEPLTPAEVI